MVKVKTEKEATKAKRNVQRQHFLKAAPQQISSSQRESLALTTAQTHRCNTIPIETLVHLQSRWWESCNKAAEGKRKLNKTIWPGTSRQHKICPPQETPDFVILATGETQKIHCRQQSSAAVEEKSNYTPRSVRLDPSWPICWMIRNDSTANSTILLRRMALNKQTTTTYRPNLSPINSQAKPRQGTREPVTN
ncbi:hypothetical protein MHYP_G00146790 [Metynnis hypsauchen]